VLEKIVENWLTSTNERGYQIPFSQLLMLQGHTVLYVSKHGQMEQGKDLITLDPDGVPCAYQLKAGNINLDRWREMQAQIQELVELPIAHPSIDKDTPFRAYLVTNGEIDDTVRRWIDDRNNSWSKKGLPTVNIIIKGELLRGFVAAQESSFPEASTSLRDFLELYLADGRDFVNKDRLASFLDGLLLNDPGIQTKDVNRLHRVIATAAVITQCLIAPFEKERNYVGTLESWTMFCACVLALVEQVRIPDKFWRPTYDIITGRLHEQLEDLKTEFLSRENYIEQPALGDGGMVYQARLTIVLGWLCAFELSCLVNSSDWQLDKNLLVIIKRRFKEWFWYWGESGTTYQIMISLFAEAAGKDSVFWDILLDKLVEICVANTSDDPENGFPDPYTTVNEIVEAKIPPARNPLDRKQFSGLSYHLAPLVHHAARLNKRIALNELWKMISKICCCEYEPTHKWHYLLWRSNEGQDKTWFLKKTQSWSELKAIATKNEGSLPEILYENPAFLYTLLLVYPHRLTTEALRLVHEKTMSCAER